MVKEMNRRGTVAISNLNGDGLGKSLYDNGHSKCLVPNMLGWYPLGSLCEIQGCDRPAYLTCDMKFNTCFCIPAFKGCTKRICMKHANYKITKEHTLEYYCCSLCKIHLRKSL